jgi:hypothetical protein
MPMPSLTDLQGMYGMGNPMAYTQARDNATLERQFREQQFVQEQEKARQAGLDTMFQEQNNPLKLENQRLVNTGQGLMNIGKETSNNEAGLAYERNKAMQQYNLDADQRKALMAVTEDEFKQADQMIEKMFRHPDPRIRQQAQQMYDFTGAARKIQEQERYKMEMERYKQQQETGRAVERNQTTLEAARIGQAGQNQRAANRGTTSTASALVKLAPERRLGTVAGILETGVDPDTGQPLSPAARSYYETMYKQDAAYIDNKPAPVSGVELGMKPNGKPGLTEKPTRESVNILNKDTKTPTEGKTKGGVKWRLVPGTNG